MKKLFLLSIGIFIILHQNLNANDIWNQKVSYSGALKNAMQKGDLSPKIELSVLKNKKNLYALGAIGYLKGEVQIFNGISMNTYVYADELKYDYTFNKNASLLVYSQVKNWIDIKVPNNIVSRSSFEDFVEESADNYGINTEKPFVFLLEGNIKSNSWHVINWDENDKVHSHAKHVESGISDTMGNTEVTMLGFYSISHAGIFTHHTTNMHIHFMTKDKKISGHSDNMTLGENMILRLPKIK